MRDALYFQGEHAPNRESRLKLCDRADEFGMPRIEAQVRFLDIDFETVRVFYRQLDRGLRASRLGHLEYDEAELDAYLASSTANFDSRSHHVGTTRMSADPKSGVVDADCKVHGVGNLYLGGCSVFPTSGHANPTFTIVALALRLADHLADQFVPARLPDNHASPAADASAGVLPVPGAEGVA
jgi:choline dehydrogenase-like flavoprotein